MIISVIKYDLWNALFASPEKDKTEAIKELENKLNNSMDKGYRVVIDDKTE